jgi:hypothetical protein
MGRQASATSASISLWVVYVGVLGIIVIQITAMARSVHGLRCRSWTPKESPSGRAQVVSTSGAILVVLPRTIGAPLPAVLTGLPDLGYPSSAAPSWRSSGASPEPPGPSTSFVPGLTTRQRHRPARVADRPVS